MKNLIFLILILISCNEKKVKSKASKMTVSMESVAPGVAVAAAGQRMNLYPGNMSIGQDISALIKSELGVQIKNKVTVVNIVPSIDTPTCEEQTHILGESQALNPGIEKVSISRDLPFAQKRFAKDAKLENIKYLSDFKTGSFGKRLGLLIKGEEIHARAVMVLDQNGVLQYFQLVPDITHLPYMDKAFEFANKLQEKFSE